MMVFFVFVKNVMVEKRINRCWYKTQDSEEQTNIKCTYIVYINQIHNAEYTQREKRLI